jgi:hypothetical protein
VARGGAPAHREGALTRRGPSQPTRTADPRRTTR